MKALPAVRRFIWFFLLFATGALALGGCSDSSNVQTGKTASSTPAFQVATQQGAVQGVGGAEQVSYKGIPYAAAPVGDLRFAPPAPPPAHSGVLMADAFGSSCPQLSGFFAEPSTDEDCLFLNVYTPKAGGDHPVMVWIHGGAFETGSGGKDYNPVRLVQKGMVVVTINYRLNAFGFLADPLLSAASNNGGSGDYGLMDQIAALRWVQSNIKQFGGDPKNVTIFGESAGGHSVLSLMVSPETKGLFERALVESGSYRPDQFTLAEEEATGGKVVDALGCDSLKCLRSASVAAILKAGANFSLQPNTRPGILPNSIAQALSTGDFNHVPVLIGANRNGGQLFVAIEELLTKSAIQPAQYPALMAHLIGQPVDSQRVQDAIATYPIADYDNTAHALAAAYTDATFACNSIAEARALSADGVPTYLYEFNDQKAPTLIPPSPSFPTYGATHAFEIQYIMNSKATLISRGADDDSVELSNQMVDYWSQFARTGDPNSSSGTDVFWPQFDASSDGSLLELIAPKPESSSGNAYSKTHHCGFWLDNGYEDAQL